MGFRFLHAADLHLDTPFEGLAVREPELRRRLVDASLEALDALVDLALRERVLFVALAGDVYDGARRGLRAQIRLLDATRRLDAAGIWTFIAHGNHDPVEEGWTAVRAWPDRVRIFSAQGAETFELEAADGTRVTVTGTSFPTRDVNIGLHARFRHPDGPGFHVAVLHANVGAVSEHMPYSPCRLDELVALEFDAWLLGHVHKRQTLRERTPFVAYPGNLQGRSFKPSEQGPKGALLVEVERGEPSARFVELAPIRFEQIDVDASPYDDVGDLVEALTEAARARAEGGRTVLARGHVHGRSPIYDDIAMEDGPSGLLDAMRDRAAALALVWTGVEVDVRPLHDLAGLRERDDLAGELVRELGRLKGDEVALRTLLAGHPGTKDLLRPELGESVSDLADRAADLALHLLGGA